MRFILLSLLIFTTTIIHSQECGVIYVAPNGATSGTAGTKANPASLDYGLTLTGPTNNRIWLAAGLYTLSQTIQLQNNLTLEGGFDANTWVKSNSTPTILSRNNTNVFAPANAIVAVAGLNMSGFRLQDLTIQVAAAATPQTSLYGVYLNGCSNYNIVRCNISTGAAGNGVAGVTGATGAAGGTGGNGLPAGNEQSNPNNGGAGGVGGNNGGDGGTRGRWAGYAPSVGNPGAGPCAGAPGTAGNRGTGPDCGCGLFGNSTNNSCGGAAPTAGGNGGNGTVGTAGAAGPAGSIIGGYFVPGSAGGNGTDGGPGCGGGGGGGGGGRQQPGSDDTGGSGGGGGGGGYGGTGGTGGTGGGSAYAIFLFTNGAGGNVIDCSLNPGTAGQGGPGGGGGGGGVGGQGGNGGTGFGCAQSIGARGGNGGDGGAGGAGGSGANGESVALSQNGGTNVNQQNITAVPGNPPVISVDNSGCVNAEVTFTSPGAGNWNFGANASPATASGSGPHNVVYTALGRKTIQFAGTTFTEFVDIFNNALTLPSLSEFGPNHFTGCPDSFRTSLVGTLYEWDFGANSLPQTTSGPSISTATTSFLSQGQRVIKVWVTTDCCGRVYDSLVINVQQSNLNVNLAASATTICAGDNVTFTASPNTYVNYRFFVNGTEVQNGAGTTYQSTTLQDGDSVNVVAFDGSCFTNISNMVNITVNQTPVVTLASSDNDNLICAGDAVTFTASPTGLTTYIFSNNGNVVQTSASNTYTPTGFTSPNSVTVVGSNGGCPSQPATAIVTTVVTVPTVTLTSSDPNDTICQGDNITFTATPAGLTNYEFFVAGNSVQSSASNTISSTLLPTGVPVYVIPSDQGCVGAQSNSITTTVIPIPSVTLAVDDNDVCAGEAVTFTATPAGYTNYDFQNNSSSVQNTALNTYITASLQPGNSITVIPTNYGCVGSASNAVSVTINPSPTVTAGADFAVCADAADVTLTGFSPSGATWSGTGITAASGTFSPTVAGVGAHALALEFTANNCTGRDTLIATVNALPVANAGADVSICDGTSSTLTASGGTSYAWAPPTNLSSTSTATTVANPTTNTTYTVTVTDANNCSATDDVTVTVETASTSSFTITAGCAGEAATITNNSNGNSYNWDFGNGTTSTDAVPNQVYNIAGSYNVTLVSGLGNCFDTSQQSVTVYPFPVAAFSALPLVAVENEDPVTFKNESTGGTTYLWDFGNGSTSSDENPTYIYPEVGVYTIRLTAISQNNCIDTAERILYIEVIENSSIFIPNLFSPNGDGSNDFFQVVAKGVRSFDLSIFNRWGEEVFQTFDTKQGWDGFYRGTMSEPGVYTYYIRLLFKNGKSQKKKGTLMLLR